MTRLNDRRLPSGRGTGGLLRGMSAVVVLLAVTAGVPLMLYTLAGSPIPSRLPGWDEIYSHLSRRDDGTLLLGFLTYLCWLLWTLWTVLLLLEVVAQLRGRAVPRIPGLDGPQRFASVL